MQTAGRGSTHASIHKPASSFNREDSLKERLGVHRVAFGPFRVVLYLDIRGTGRDNLIVGNDFIPGLFFLCISVIGD